MFFYSAKILSTNLAISKNGLDEVINKMGKITENLDHNLAEDIKQTINRYTEDMKSKHQGEIASFSKKTLLIIKTNEFWRFLRKSFLNPSAYSQSSLYAEGISNSEPDEVLNPKLWIQCLDHFISNGIKLNFLGHSILSTRGLHSENFTDLSKQLGKKLESLICYSVEKSVQIPLKSEALPILRETDGKILSVFSPEINSVISGISMKILQILVGKVTNQQLVQFGSSLEKLTETVKEAFISSGIALSNQEVIMANLPQMVTKAMKVKQKV